MRSKKWHAKRRKLTAVASGGFAAASFAALLAISTTSQPTTQLTSAASFFVISLLVSSAALFFNILAYRAPTQIWMHFFFISLVAFMTGVIALIDQIGGYVFVTAQVTALILVPYSLVVLKTHNSAKRKQG